MRGRKHELLSPAVSRAVGEVLRSPGQSLFPQVGQDRAAAGDASQLAVTSPGDEVERQAKQAESRPPARLNFTNVRVHTDEKAAETARSLHAKAFTVGNHMVFGEGRFAPQSPSGQRLLWHELAHTGQPGAEHRLARDPVEGMEVKGIDLDRSKIEGMTGGSYWEQKVMQTFSLTYDSTAQSRFGADAEERDAVLSSLLQHAPKGKLASPKDVNVSVPARPAVPTSKQVLYHGSFTPAAQGAKQDALTLEFKQEGSAAKVDAAGAPAAGYTPTPLSTATYDNFPDGKDKYFKAHPDEYNQLFNWIDTAPAKFKQVVTTKETVKSKVHESSFQVEGQRDPKGVLTSLGIDFLGETPTFTDAPPAGYASKDLTDIELDKQRDKTSDKLGQITGLATLPADEQLSVKYVVWQYFAGGTRNKEVDVTIPVAKKTTNVFYTLRFQPNNDVSVERVGDPDSKPELMKTGLNITRVEGFAANSKDAARFSAWVKTRYPSVKVTGTTLQEEQDSVNKDMASNAGTTAWFSSNYGIEVLDDTTGATRLSSVHKLVAGQTADMKVFQADELKSLEFALETMSDAELKLLKDVRFARQKVFLELVGRTITPKPATGGETFQNGSDRTVVIYDGATVNDKSLFLGGKRGVREESVETYTHELGHALGGKNNLEAAFKTFVAAKKIKPITWYAASKPATESFPEAFAFYQNDPEWMQNNLPDLFTWFETVKKTGSPPTP